MPGAHCIVAWTWCLADGAWRYLQRPGHSRLEGPTSGRIAFARS